MKNSLTEHTTHLESGNNLSSDQVEVAANLLTDESVPVSEKTDFLKSLARKGETDEEFSSFVSSFRSFAISPKLDDFSTRAIDLCGTGGDRSGSFNISTVVSMIVAAGGVPVIKHGNRSISSKCGSADLLEALGIPLLTDDALLNASLDHLNFCFLFAPHFHPAFKCLAPVRKSLAQEGVITLFNRLGPCLNPASPSYQIVGVYNPSYLEQIAHSLEMNGSKAGWVVHGIINKTSSSGMDELTACGTNLVRPYGTIRTGEINTYSSEYWGQQTFATEDLRGGSLKDNLSILDSVISGGCPKGLRASIVINAASAFWISGSVSSIIDGVNKADQIIESGTLSKWLTRAQDFFAK